MERFVDSVGEWVRTEPGIGREKRKRDYKGRGSDKDMESTQHNKMKHVPQVEYVIFE